MNFKKQIFGFMDMLRFKKMVPTRRRMLAEGENKPLPQEYRTNTLAKKLHPGYMQVELTAARPLTDTIRELTFKRVDAQEFPFFRAGQYVSLQVKIGGSLVSRPYSIVSTPRQALENKLVLAVEDAGFVSGYLCKTAAVGDRFVMTEPSGEFHYETLRDSKDIICIAGGSGITPFFSMAEAIADGIEDFELTILYGSRTAEGILLREELDAVAARSGGRVKVVHVLSDEEREGYEHGFLTAELVKKYAPEGDYSVFMCGPQAMYDYEEQELQKLSLPRRRIRRELSGDCIMSEPAKVKYKLTLDIHGYRRTIDCLANESLEWAIERAGIKAPTHCRSGECGWCHARLVSGEVFVPERADGRRDADLKFGWLHPCASFPRSDVELEIFPG